MEIVFGDLSLGVRKGGAEYIFAYNTGGLESLRKGSREFVFRRPDLAFWRATTDNDRGCGFSARSSVWMGADRFFKVENYSVTADGTLLRWDELIAPANNSLIDSPLRKASSVSIRFAYSTVTKPEAEVFVTYSLSEEGSGLRVDYEYRGTEGLPGLPVCGLRFTLPFPVDSFDWEGLSGETYPDRMWGAQEGVFHHEGAEICPYVMPQEYGMHMRTRRLTMHVRKDSLSVSAVTDEGFNFSLLPNSPHELENAWHNIELPAYRRSYLTIAAAVRGVGGIDSWGSDVGERWQIDSAGTYRTSFVIE